jgi:hypothetical protein
MKSTRRSCGTSLESVRVRCAILRRRYFLDLTIRIDFGPPCGLSLIQSTKSFDMRNLL